MSKDETDLPERLRSTGATNLERRLIDAAGRERPSRELSERMARSLGVTLAVTEIVGSVKTGTSVSAATKASSSLVPWLSGAVVATGIAIGVYVVTRPAAKPVTPTPAALALSASAAVSVPAPTNPSPIADAPLEADGDSLPKAAAAGRGRRGTVAGELANQIALVDAARSALAAGNAQRALSLARQYQSEYANGTFGPEVSAVKIEALVKLGRMTEARTLAERFVVAHGPGPLAERVARLALITKP